jgi:hypothetical protein
MTIERPMFPPVDPTRRRLLTIAAAGIAAALPVAAPANSTPPSPDFEIDHKAILARVEQIVDLLRTCYVREGWKIDEGAADRALRYFRRHVEGPPLENEDQDTTEFHEGVVEFVGSHGQSLDWIFDGDPGGMICRLAARSKRAGDTPADAELLALVDQYIAAEAEHLRVCQIANDLEAAFLDKGKPEALQVQPADAELGIRAFFGRLGEDHNQFNIDMLRLPEWPHPDSKVELALGRLVAERLFRPSAEARSRADEIIAASDEWQRTRQQKKPRRLLAAGRKRDKANAMMAELDEQIAEMPATSLEGMIAKARCAQAYDKDCCPDCDDPLSMFSASIVRDLLAMGEVQS